MRWLIGGALVSAGLVLVVAGPTPHLANQPAPWQRPLAERSCDPWPRRLPDAAAVTVIAPARRVVAASVLSAEVMLALAPERLLAVHYLALDPRFSAAEWPAGDQPRTTDGSPEHVLALGADLVLTDAFTRAETQALLVRAGVPLLRTAECRSLADVRDNLRRIGYGVGLDAAAEHLIDELDARLGRVAATAATRSAWHLLSLDGALHTYGRGSIFDDLLHVVGAVNLAAAHGAPAFRKLDAEAVLSWQPDALVVGANPGGEADELARLRQHPVLAALPCVRAGRIVFVPHAAMASTSQHVASAAEAIARTLDGWGPP